MTASDMREVEAMIREATEPLREAVAKLANAILTRDSRADQCQLIDEALELLTPEEPA